MRRSTWSFVSLVPLLVFAGRAEAQSFQAGDLYLNTASATGACGTCGGVVHIDPTTGAASILTSSAANGGPIAYDPFRDRLIVTGDFAPTGAGVYAVDALGGAQEILAALPHGIAPTGDGRIYLIGGFFEASGEFDLVRYVDASGTLHALKDQGGAASFFLSTAGDLARDLIYDPVTNSLFTSTSPGFGSCPGGPGGAVSIYRIPLSADGTQVSGAVACSGFDVAVGSALEGPVGFSHGPNGLLMLVADDNSNDAAPRMLTIDPASLATAAYAVSGPYLGAAATDAGSYSSVLHGAVVLDTGNDVLRLFHAGEAGTGAAFGSGPLSGAGGSGEVVRMAEITGIGEHYGLSSDVGSISLSAGGAQVLHLDAGPAHGGELYLVLGSLSGWSPGVAYGGMTLPLNPDSYWLHTLSHPNTFPLSTSFGVLDAAGTGDCTFQLPAGFLPSLAGVTAYHAGVALNGALAPTWTSNAVPVALLP